MCAPSGGTTVQQHPGFALPAFILFLSLQKLIGAVHECDKGRVPLLLSRTQSTKSLFEGSGSVSLSGAAAEGVEDLRQQLAELRTRVRGSTDAAVARQQRCFASSCFQDS